MSDDDRRRFTIGQAMTAVAITGVAVWLVLNPGSARSISVLAGFIGVGFLVLVAAVSGIDVVLGIRCPRCRRWAMARTTLICFRDRYFRCTSCQGRCRRGFLRGWEDASDPSFDLYYSRKRPENPWTAGPSLDDDEYRVWTKTHGNLLLNKRRRNPNPPEQSTNRDPNL